MENKQESNITQMQDAIKKITLELSGVSNDLISIVSEEQKFLEDLHFQISILGWGKNKINAEIAKRVLAVNESLSQAIKRIL